MLGFAPIAATTLGGAGTQREVVPVGITGVQASCPEPVFTSVFSTNSSVTPKAVAVISTDAVRAHNTTVWHVQGGVGSTKFVDSITQGRNYFDKNLILGNRQQIGFNAEGGDPLTGPVWDDALVTYGTAEGLSMQTQLNGAVNDQIVYQDAFAPLTNGTYTYPATTTPGGVYPQTPHLFHLTPAEDIADVGGINTATVTTLADPSFELSVSTYENIPVNGKDGDYTVVVGQFQIINTFDETNSIRGTTYFDPLVTAQAGDETTDPARPLEMAGENKSRTLFHLLPDSEKGLQINETPESVQVQTIGTDRYGEGSTGLYHFGAAYIFYGIRLQPEITDANFPNGDPVPQEHSLLNTVGLGAITTEVVQPVVGFESTAAVPSGHIQTKVLVRAYKELTPPPINVDIPESLQDLTPFPVGFDMTVGSFDPQWYLNPPVKLHAQDRQYADSVVYPYPTGLSAAGTSTTTFNMVASVSELLGPKVALVPIYKELTTLPDGGILQNGAAGDAGDNVLLQDGNKFSLNFPFGSTGFEVTTGSDPVTTQSFNTIPWDATQYQSELILQESFSDLTANPTEIVYSNDSQEATVSFNSSLTFETFANAVCLGQSLTPVVADLTAIGQAEAEPSGVQADLSVNLNATGHGDANIELPESLELAPVLGILGVKGLAEVDGGVEGTVSIEPVGTRVAVAVDASLVLTPEVSTLSATGIKFDYSAIADLYNRGRSLNVTRSQVSFVRQVKPTLSAGQSYNLAA
jgi:hypothetical protein